MNTDLAAVKKWSKLDWEKTAMSGRRIHDWKSGDLNGADVARVQTALKMKGLVLQLDAKGVKVVKL